MLDSPESIVVITSDQRAITGMEELAARDMALDIRVLNLDDVVTVEHRLSEGLPTDPTLARAVIEERFARIGQSKLGTQLRDAYQGLALAVKYGLNRYPAIIFNEQAVILGVTDLVAATSRYRQWLKSREGIDRD